MVTLRLELEGFKEHVVHALLDHHDEVKRTCEQLVRTSLDTLTPEFIVSHMDSAVQNGVREGIKKVLPEIVEEAVQTYFTHGEGQQLILDALRRKFAK